MAEYIVDATMAWLLIAINFFFFFFFFQYLVAIVSPCKGHSSILRTVRTAIRPTIQSRQHFFFSTIINIKQCVIAAVVRFHSFPSIRCRESLGNVDIFSQSFETVARASSQFLHSVISLFSARFQLFAYNVHVRLSRSHFTFFSQSISLSYLDLSIVLRMALKQSHFRPSDTPCTVGKTDPTIVDVHFITIQIDI